MTIQEFRAKVLKQSVLRTNRFSVLITLPAVVGTDVEASRTISLLAESINLPGITFNTTQNRRYGYGVIEKYASDATFNDLTVSFITDGDNEILGIFRKWMSSIMLVDNLGAPDSSPFFFEYKDNYTAPGFTIDVRDEKDDIVTIYDIYYAFPTSISDITLDWNSNDEVAKFTVTFSYAFWKVRPLG